ncbi:hypothetical protein GCM10027180_12800 [Microbulbifer echini]
MYLHGKVKLGVLKSSVPPLQCLTMGTRHSRGCNNQARERWSYWIYGGVVQWLELNSSAH